MGYVQRDLFSAVESSLVDNVKKHRKELLDPDGFDDQ